MGGRVVSEEVRGGGRGGMRDYTWMRAEREAGAGEERRWRGCLWVIM